MELVTSARTVKSNLAEARAGRKLGLLRLPMLFSPSSSAPRRCARDHASSDIAASRAGGGDEWRVLLVNALATGFGISALILSLNPVSGACFNPLAVVLEQW